jgi:hypothetical protein
MDLGCHDAARGGEDLVHFDGGSIAADGNSSWAVGSQHASRRERRISLDSSLNIDLAVDPRFLSDDVEQAVVTALTEPEKGHLALQNIPIGLRYFAARSWRRFTPSQGTAVRALRFNGTEAPFGIRRARVSQLSVRLVAGNTAGRRSGCRHLTVYGRRQSDDQQPGSRQV